MNLEKYDLYDIYRKPKYYRIKELEENEYNDYAILAIFLRNYSVYLHFNELINDNFIETDLRPSEIFQNIRKYSVFSRAFVYEGVYKFALLEEKAFQDEKDETALAYYTFITSRLSQFKTMDVLLSKSLSPNEINIRYFSNYVKSVFVNYPNLDSKEIDIDFSNLKKELVQGVFKALFQQATYSILQFQLFKDSIDSILFHLNNKLIKNDHKREIQHHALLYFEQFIESFCFQLKIDLELPIIQELLSYFKQGLLCLKKEVVSQFPNIIFRDYDSYHLFTTLAKHLTTKVNVSYLYRVLFDKGRILVKDTQFREWYNAQGYPLHLSTATETLQNSKSTDRELYVGIIAGLLGIEDW